MSKFNGIKEGDVVRIKFRSMQDITKEMKMTTKLQYLSEYDIGTNINALMLGGDFVVICAKEAQAKTDAHIEIDNHHDGGSFHAHEEIIDTIEAIEVANKFVSDEHGIIMIQVADKIYINGELLENQEDEQFLDESEKKQLDKFTAFMEKYVIAAAFEGSLEDEDDEKEEGLCDA